MSITTPRTYRTDVQAIPAASALDPYDDFIDPDDDFEDEDEDEVRVLRQLGSSLAFLNSWHLNLQGRRRRRRGGCTKRVCRVCGMK